MQLFRSIPLADLKALYPNARAQVSWMRKAMIAASTVITGVPLLMKIIPALSVLLLVMAAYLGISGKVEEDSLKKAIASGTILAAFIGLGLREPAWEKVRLPAISTTRLATMATYFFMTYSLLIVNGY